MGQHADRKSNRTRQTNKKGDSKVESKDSLEIPDKGATSANYKENEEPRYW